MPELRLESLHLEIDPANTAWLTFNHGKANEIGSVELGDIERVTAWLRATPAIRTLISRSDRVSKSGTPIFVAGANVTERTGWTDDDIKRHVRRQRAALAALAAAPVLHVGLVAGVAFGWGTEYLLTCDYVLAIDGARFALPETGIGILPGAGGTSELQLRIGPAQALRLGMTGEAIDAAEAVRIGLAQERFAAAEPAEARARQLAAACATRSPTANATFKHALRGSQGRNPVERAEIEARAYERCVDSGEAAIGRARFSGAPDAPGWGPRRLPDGEG